MIKFPLIVRLVGVSFGNAQENIKTFAKPDIRWFAMLREPDNQHDPNAIRVALFGEFFHGVRPQGHSRSPGPAHGCWQSL